VVFSTVGECDQKSLFCWKTKAFEDFPQNCGDDEMGSNPTVTAKENPRETGGFLHSQGLRGAFLVHFSGTAACNGSSDTRMGHVAERRSFQLVAPPAAAL